MRGHRREVELVRRCRRKGREVWCYVGDVNIEDDGRVLLLGGLFHPAGLVRSVWRAVRTAVLQRLPRRGADGSFGESTEEALRDGPVCVVQRGTVAVIALRLGYRQRPGAGVGGGERRRGTAKEALEVAHKRRASLALRIARDMSEALVRR